MISTTDFTEERYQVGEQLFLFRDKQEVLPLKISSYRRHKNFDLLSFEGYENINLVEPFRDGILKISEKQLSELDEHEYYYHEIIGLIVVDEDEKEIGKITEILSPGANDVWVVKRKGQRMH